MLEVLVFILGGIAYGVMEILFRGYTHWTMVITGGVCVLTFYLFRSWLLSAPLGVAAFAGACIITFYELAVGYVVNVQLGWNVWDYSHEKINFLGQICLRFSLIWYGISFIWLGVIKLIRYFI